MLRKKRNPFTYYLPHIVVVDYSRVKRKDFKMLSDEEYAQMKTAPYIIDKNGKIYINKHCKEYLTYVKYFITMSDESTLSLIQALNEAKKKYPDIKCDKDIFKYTNKYDLQCIGFLAMIPVELERRNRLNKRK